MSKILNEKYSKSGINLNTFKLLFDNYENLPVEEQGELKALYTLATLDLFTRTEEKGIFASLLKFYYKTKNIDLDKISYNSKLGLYEYKDGDEVITFDKISRCINDEEFIKELNSKERYKSCHSGSKILSQGVTDSRIVTGYITVGDRRILHSVVEYDCDNDTLVLDWNLNIEMSKTDYIKLNQFKQLSVVNSENVMPDLRLLRNLGISLEDKAYLTFRDEIISDLEKNSHMFEELEGKRHR